MHYFLITFNIPVGQGHVHTFQRLVKADHLEAAFEIIKRIYPNAMDIQDETIRQ